MLAHQSQQKLQPLQFSMFVSAAVATKGARSSATDQWEKGVMNNAAISLSEKTSIIPETLICSPSARTS